MLFCFLLSLGMDNLMTTLRQSPRLCLYYQKIKAILKDEKMKRVEFYSSINEDQKAEFINGEIIIHSPIILRHDKTRDLLSNLLNNYVRINNLGYVGGEKMMINLTRNDYEPDICFWKKEKSSKFKPDQLLFPIPDLIVEVLSDSTKDYDRGIKFDDYAAHLVAEYWIIDPDLQTIEQYVLYEDTYKLLKKAKGKEILTSDAVNGFTIPGIAIFDEKENIKALKKILSYE